MLLIWCETILLPNVNKKNNKIIRFKIQEIECFQLYQPLILGF